MRIEKAKQLKKEFLELIGDKNISFEELQEIDSIVLDLEIETSSKYEEWREMMMHC